MIESTLLEGGHVRLEPLRPEHVPGLFAAATISRESYAFASVPATLAEMEAYVARALARRDRGEAVPFASVQQSSGTVVGSTRFAAIQHYGWRPEEPLARIVDSVEIGWTWLAPAAQRTGINTEAKYLMLTHAFESWRCHRVTIKTDSRNERSRRAIERIGATFEGILRSDSRGHDGALRSSAYYSVIEADWPQVKAGLEAKLAAHG